MRKRVVLLMAWAALFSNANANEITKAEPANTGITSTKNSLVLEITPGLVTKDLVVNFTEAASGSSITITDLKGARILSQSVDAGSSKAIVNVSKLDAGTYFVVFSNGEARTSKLFVKQ